MELKNIRKSAARIIIKPRPQLGPKAQQAMKEIEAGTYVPGLYFIPDFLTGEEQDKIARLLVENGKHYFLNAEKQQKRRSAQFGWVLNYKSMELYRGKGLHADLPQELNWIREKLHTKMKEELGRDCKLFNQLILNEYYPKQFISHHVDQ